MKIYRMIIENMRTKERKTYTNSRAGSAPAGWRCVAVCGYYEKQTEGK